MKQVVTKGIVLTRIDFQEADRILTLLTPDHGKVSVLAKGVRRQKSKLAGGIELLSVSDITYMPGRSELSTLMSSRLITHYGQIVTDIQRTMLAYEFIKIINKVTEAPAGEEYFGMLQACMAGLNQLDIAQSLVELWFDMQLLKVTGQAPNLASDSNGDKFEAESSYLFSFDDMIFVPQADGPHSAKLIKLLRLAYATESPLVLGKVRGTEDLAAIATRLLKPLVYSAFGL